MAVREFISDIVKNRSYDYKSISSCRGMAVTNYATHNTEWTNNDNRRTMLQSEIVQFLNRPRDIKPYIDAFAR